MFESEGVLGSVAELLHLFYFFLLRDPVGLVDLLEGLSEQLFVDVVVLAHAGAVGLRAAREVEFFDEVLGVEEEQEHGRDGEQGQSHHPFFPLGVELRPLVLLEDFALLGRQTRPLSRSRLEPPQGRQSTQPVHY